jgi:hypothetical protein
MFLQTFSANSQASEARPVKKLKTFQSEGCLNGMNNETLNRNNEWLCLLMDIRCLQMRIANFKVTGKLFRPPYPAMHLKELCLSNDYFQSRGLS